MDIPSGFYAAAQGGANLANSLTHLAGTIASIESHRAQTEATAMRMADVSRYTTDLSVKLTDYIQRAQEDDPANVSAYRPIISNLFDEGYAKINEQRDPVTKSLLMRAHDHLQMSFGKTFKDVEIKQNHRAAQNAFFDGMQAQTKIYSMTDNPDIEAEANTQVVNLIQAAEIGGIITPEMVTRQKEYWEKVITRKEGLKILNAIAGFKDMPTEDINKFIKDIADPNKYQAVKDPVQRREYYNQAVTAANKIMTERKMLVAQKEAETNWPDPGEAAANVTRTDFIDRHKLTIDQAQNIAQSFRSQYVYKVETENKRVKAAHDGELNAIGDLIVKGDTPGAMKATQEAKYIPGMDKAKIIHSLQQPQPEGKSNSTVYLEGVDIMYDSSKPIEEKKAWLLKNRSQLNITDFKHLSNIGMSQERSNDKQAVKGGIETLKTALSFPGMQTQTGKERLDRAIKMYESGVVEYKDSLNTPEKIKAYANTILSMPEFSNVNPLEDMKADMKALKGGGRGATPSPQRSVPVAPQSNIPALRIGTTATNPKTGAKVTWDGTKWK